MLIYVNSMRDRKGNLLLFGGKPQTNEREKTNKQTNKKKSNWKNNMLFIFFFFLRLILSQPFVPYIEFKANPKQKLLSTYSRIIIAINSTKCAEWLGKDGVISHLIWSTWWIWRSEVQNCAASGFDNCCKTVSKKKQKRIKKDRKTNWRKEAA